MIKHKKLLYNINRKAAKYSALSIGRIDKNEYLTSEDLLTFIQSEIMKQVKFTCLGRPWNKLAKIIQCQSEQ